MYPPSDPERLCNVSGARGTIGVLSAPGKVENVVKRRLVRRPAEPPIVIELHEMELAKLRRRIASLESQKKSLGDLLRQVIEIQNNPKYR
jgi:hypothetical protein